MSEVFGWEWLSVYREPLLWAGQVVLILLLARLQQPLLARGLGPLIVGSACKPGARGRVLDIKLFYTTFLVAMHREPGCRLPIVCSSRKPCAAGVMANFPPPVSSRFNPYGMAGQP